jgi:hypothetical protein
MSAPFKVWPVEPSGVLSVDGAILAGKIAANNYSKNSDLIAKIAIKSVE